MHRGRYQLGQRVPLFVWCKNADGSPALPDDVPVADVYSGTALVLTIKLPIQDRHGIPGYFGRVLHLDARFTTGTHHVVYHYLTANSPRIEADQFEVIAGGDVGGAVISLQWFERPHARFLVQQLDSRRLAKGRNPRL